jgi:hypothetical protein
MGKKNSRKQKIYKMVGCSKTRKNYLGGSTDTPLAYTGKSNPTYPNPYLAYTGKGGSKLNVPNNIPVNTNAANPAYPNTGPVSAGSNTIFNNANQQRGGCGSCPVMKGGSCGSCSIMKGGRGKKGGSGCSLCSMGFMVGGKRHRNGCKCSDCKKKRLSGEMKGGNYGSSYPNGLVGSPWRPEISGWPGVDGISGNRNYYAPNTFSGGDPQTSMVNVGANPPFLNLKGGKRKQRGGTVSNLLGQDLVNLGRQFQFGIGSAYNALAGYPAPINPLPWKGQFPTSNSFNPAII